LPALAILGYITAGTMLGTLITSGLGRAPGNHPYLAAFLGVLLLQIVVVIPFVGWMVATLSGLWGAGAIGLVAYNAARGRTAGEAELPAQPAA
jgi:hypothetical protein